MRPIPQLLAELVTFTEEILHRKLHFLCCDTDELFSVFSMVVRDFVDTHARLKQKSYWWDRLYFYEQQA